MEFNSLRTRVIEEAKRIENDAMYSAKGHYEDAHYWSRFHVLVGVPVAMLAAIAGASALAQFDNHSVIAGILSIIVAALTAIITFLNPNEKANAHQNVGNKYNALRRQAHAFCTIDAQMEDIHEQELVKQVKELAKQRDELNLISPPISNMAYKKVYKALKNKKEGKPER